MAFIENITFDNRLQLGAETLARQLTIGTNWQRLRIGIRCSIADALGSLVYSGFYLGVMQGTLGWASPLTPDAFTANVTTNEFESTISPTQRVRDGNGVMCYRLLGVISLLKQFNTIYQGTANTSSNVYIPVTHTGLLGAVIATVTKGNPISIQCAGTTNANLSRSAFLNALENDVTAPAGFSNLSNASIAYTGSNLFDSAFVFWNHSTPTLDIADFGVVRFS